MSKMNDLMKQAGVNKDIPEPEGDFFAGTKLEEEDLFPHPDLVVPVTELLTEEAPTIDVPSIHSSAVLVNLHVSVWQARRKDKSASQKVTANAGAARNSADVRKSLLPDCVEHEAIKKFVANNRNAHYSMTLPWADRGDRLLATSAMFDFHNYVTGLKDEFDKLCEAFFSVYEWYIAKAEAKLGDLFNKNDYPPLADVKRKYSFTVGYAPVPDSGDFRVDLQNDALGILKEHCDSHYKSKVQAAMDDMWKQLYVPLANMSTRLDYADRKDNTGFRDTLVDNVTDIVTKMQNFNITNDPHMEACRAKLESALHGITPDALREDDVLRAETKRGIDEVLRELPSMDF